MLGFFNKKQQKPRAFNYQPRFYDARKEALEERITEHEQERSNNSNNGENAKARIRQHFASQRSQRRSTPGLLNMTNIRIFVIMAGLFLLVYMTMNRWLPVIMNYFFPNEEF